MRSGYSTYIIEHKPRPFSDCQDSGTALAYLNFRTAYAAMPPHLLPVPRQKTLSDKNLLLADRVDKTLIETCLQAPHAGLIELGEPAVDVVERIEIMAALDVIGCSLTSLTASQINLAPLLCRAAQRRFGMADITLTAMGLALQEASINALAHGNLGLRSAFEETDDDLDTYYQLVRERAAQDGFKDKRIDILAWQTKDTVLIAVRDQGKGYKAADRRLPESSRTPPVDRRKLNDRRQSGRGLDIMQKFSQNWWISTPGTSIVMGFDK
ncbi:MAG: ATP-binding protein [Rhodospirillales bacterium]|nr:ATP-binding protein [Rhodospirillales bacterium]